MNIGNERIGFIKGGLFLDWADSFRAINTQNVSATGYHSYCLLWRPQKPAVLTEGFIVFLAPSTHARAVL